MRTGTIVNSTIIAVPSSPKSEGEMRDSEMHRTKKGNLWHFGMKAHIGVDAESGLVHSVVGTAANVADGPQASSLLHGEEEVASAMRATAACTRRGRLRKRISKYAKPRPSAVAA